MAGDTTLATNELGRRVSFPRSAWSLGRASGGTKRKGNPRLVRYWEIIADNLGKRGWTWGWSQPSIHARERCSLLALTKGRVLTIAAKRSSIRSRSTSQYLSDERRREGVGSWLVSSCAVIARRNVADLLPDLRLLRRDLDARERVRLGRRVPINFSTKGSTPRWQRSCANRRNI